MEKTYKIGIDARLWNETGVGRYIRNLVNQLQKIDTSHEFVLFALSKDAAYVKSQITNPKFQIKIADIRWHTLKEQLQFGKILEKEKLDLVHFPYFSVPIFTNIPFVVTIHDLILHHFPTGKASTLPLPMYYLKQLGYRYVVQQAAKKAKKIMTVSQATAQQIVQDLHVSKDKIVVTYEGTDSRFMIQDSRIKDKSTIYSPRGEAGHLSSTIYFLYVGNAYPHKNLERLIHAFAQMINDEGSRIKELKLILVGKEDYFYKRLKMTVKRLGLEQKIVFKHEVSDEELSELYQNALGLLVPSLMEGFGLTGLEAMANSCLVIASSIPSLKEIYKEAAIYFDPSSIQDMENALKKVYSISEKEKDLFIEKGKERVKDFSWKTMAAHTQKVYESCIGL